MYAIGSEHSQIVLDSLTGQRATNEQTFASIGILAEKLETLRKLHRCFLDVEFSPMVSDLVEQESELAIS
jgi:hypothetical protein